ncbi:Peroxidasin [Brachionus plicatilis]|uniref:Peroxidasin n=1 Tax=Brachionus plicatilis TaxID=10195 RepID=A0A3M7R7N0_BRAPC|nr:Peroxidasin [Brachionus plicatilis]
MRHLTLFFLIILVGVLVDETRAKCRPRRTTTKKNSLAERQEKLNSDLQTLFARNRTRLPRNAKKIRSKMQSNMRQSSTDAFFINQITSLAIKTALNSTTARSTATDLSIDSQYCPFTDVTCDFTSKYRSANGSCNNEKNPLYGAANTPYQRVLPVAYQDGFNSARSLSVTGSDLPHPRTASLKVSPPPDRGVHENTASHIYAIFGQFLIHDISGTSATTDSDGVELDCPCGSTDSDCLPLEWPQNDLFLDQECMKFTRSSASFPDFDCNLSYREQLNLLSSFIDGSGIYGIDQDRADELRTFSGGLLATSEPLNTNNVQVTSGDYLPLSSDTCSSSSDPTYNCFLAGEYRTSENLGLVSIHTLFLREHNRIAGKLATNNPTWTDEELYQETRRIVIALLQHIVYNEWVPMINGSRDISPDLDTTQYFTGYDSSINPALTNEFSTAAFRFGHSLIRDKFNRYKTDDTRLAFINFTDLEFKSDYAYDIRGEGIFSIFKGLMNDNCWKFGSFGDQLQNSLFAQTTNGVFSAHDLLATNIHRGRDHGLRPYIDYVNYCHGIVVSEINDLRDLIGPTRRNALVSIYEDVADIDLYAGALLEKKDSDSYLAAPTFSCLIMEQFANLKKGDRFYYENDPSVNPGAFTLEQLTEIKKITMAGLICNNYEIAELAGNVFYTPSDSNPSVDCSTLKEQVDLSKWTGEL